MKTVYTENAKSELNEFLSRQQKMLEDVVASRKYIYGDEVLEVTASDIREASRYILPINTGKLRNTLFRRLIIQSYLVLGFLLICGGIFYPIIQEMIVHSPIQVMLISIGVTIIFVAIFMQVYFKFRDDRRKQMLEMTFCEEEKFSQPEH